LGGEVLGILRDDPQGFLERERGEHLARSGLSLEQLGEMIAARNRAREGKDFAQADAIRAELAERYAIELRDFPGRTEWGVKR
jgi:cysteinyl-tRNA synthetase